MSRFSRPILVECKPDEVLVRALGIPCRRIHHQGSKGDICNTLRRLRNAIALMDEDPGSLQPRYLRDLMNRGTAIEETSYGILMVQDHQQEHLILILRPRLEGWILKVARRNGIEMNKFGLPDQEKDLHEEINDRLPNFEQLIRALAESEALQFLRERLR